MDGVSSGKLFLFLFLFISALDLQSRSLLASPVNQVFHSKDDLDNQIQILAHLLRKNFLPLQEKEVLGVQLARKIAELQELAVIQEELNLESRRPMTSKRDDACFWKYCV